MKKYQNYGLWVSIFSLIGLVLGNYGLFDRLGLTSETYKAIIDGILAILVTAGIISNPSSGKGFIDK